MDRTTGGDWEPFALQDHSKFQWFHWKSMLTTSMGVFADGHDLSSIGIVLPLILPSFGVKPLVGIEASLLTASALGGAVIGALIFGLLANKGRKRFYGFDVMLMTLGALLQIFVTNVPELIAVRLLLGIGVGADYVLSPMITGEHSNAKDRGKTISFGFGLMWGFGAVLAAFLYFVLHGLGVAPGLVWRVVLGFGAVPTIAIIYLRRRMPETARFLGRIKGGAQATASVVSQASNVTTGSASFQNLKDPHGFGFYFRREWRVFLGACLLWFLFDMVAYSSILFGPSVIAKHLGLGPDTFQFPMEGVFTVPGGILALLLVDRAGRKPLQVLGFLGIAAALISHGLVTGAGALASAPVLAFALYGSQNFFSQAGPGSVSASGMLRVELAPTKVRGTVQALTVASPRRDADGLRLPVPHSVLRGVGRGVLPCRAGRHRRACDHVGRPRDKAQEPRAVVGGDRTDGGEEPGRAALAVRPPGVSASMHECWIAPCLLAGSDPVKAHHVAPCVSTRSQGRACWLEEPCREPLGASVRRAARPRNAGRDLEASAKIAELLTRAALAPRRAVAPSPPPRAHAPVVSPKL